MLDNVISLLHDFAISWFGQAVCKLPFIKESRLLAEVTKVEHSLTVMLNFVKEFFRPETPGHFVHIGFWSFQPLTFESHVCRMKRSREIVWVWTCSL